jgi:hypothetical protein
MRGSKRQLPAGILLLLIHHYIAAFGELHGQGRSPDGAWELRVLCNIKANFNYANPSEKDTQQLVILPHYQS